ncbi:DUF2953 domain-containing protein [Aestuariicoccus sp. MJ-SS9]|uniref:DUF2953 domain-containing protein n=1 Tax=Aestuariicoccus sp. MJ-SS9 TaxID=3079855 RepID=UPI0029112ACB|nr:DUF2953 domain-containing protein [Aestuariicoccus sp. MJ-SS9]MDU8911623.1 DUF2953 domain-containing protein [Aestuariicoccus sp. MJ-SS9]
MQTLGLILLALIGALLALAVLALVLPLRVWLAFDTGARRKLAVQVQPLGRFGPRVPVTGRAGKSRTSKPKAHKKRRPRLRGRAIGWAPVKRLIAGVTGAIHLEEARLDAAFGLGDPADTGQAFGLLTPLIYGSAGAPRSDVVLRPVFDRACLEGTGHLLWRARPVAVLWPMARFGWEAFGPTAR